MKDICLKNIPHEEALYLVGKARKPCFRAFCDSKACVLKGYRGDLTESVKL